MDILDTLLAPPSEWPAEVVGPLFSSGLVMLIIIILVIIVNIQARHANPLKKPKGLLFAYEYGVEFFDHMTADLMGEKFRGFGGFIFAVAVYLFLAFIIGLTGLPSPMTNLAIPLSLGFMTFVLIHVTSIKYTKWKYFKRYVDPMPLFLPINLLSMWAPLLSLTFRLFGNALAGSCLMTVIYYFCQTIGEKIVSIGENGALSGMYIAPYITPLFHAYFDLFSAFIQTTVFIMLTMLFLANEVPDEDEIEEKLSM